MTTRIEHLNNLYQRLLSAMSRRIMAEAGRRACVKDPKALERYINQALGQAADLYPLSARVTLSRLLDQDPATLGMIQCSPEELRCENTADLCQAYADLKAGLRIEDDQELFKKLEQKMGEPGKLRYSLKDILANFERIFYGSWQMGRRFQRMKKQLTPEQLFDIFLKFVVHRERTKMEIAKDLHRIRGVLGHINESTAKINSTWVTRYGLEIFPELFEMSCAEYLKSRLFWDAKQG
jgi:hypothetical protein